MSACTCDYSDMPSPVDPACPQHGVRAAPGEWVEIPPQVEGECSWPTCTEPAIWRRKEGWSVAPGSPDGDVCETHHCWEPIPRKRCRARISIRGMDRVECSQDRGHPGAHLNESSAVVWVNDGPAREIPTRGMRR